MVSWSYNIDKLSLNHGIMVICCSQGEAPHHSYLVKRWMESGLRIPNFIFGDFSTISAFLSEKVVVE